MLLQLSADLHRVCYLQAFVGEFHRRKPHCQHHILRQHRFHPVYHLQREAPAIGGTAAKLVVPLVGEGGEKLGQQVTVSCV